MKNKRYISLAPLCILLGVLFFYTGCTKCTQRKNKTLYLFNWTYYTPDSVITQFEKEFGVDVKIDSYASNEEMFAKLLAGAYGYDIVFPSQDYTAIMIKLGMLEKIDLTKIPNNIYVNPEVLKKATYDPTMKYSVPYYMGAAGVAVNKTKVANYDKSWDIFVYLTCYFFDICCVLCA